MSEHEHKFEPLKSDRKDLVILFCECGETRVTQLPKEVKDRPSPIFPSPTPLPPVMPSPTPWRPYEPRWPQPHPTRPIIWCNTRTITSDRTNAQ